MKKMAMVLLLCVMVLSVMAIDNEANALPAFPGWFNCTVVSCGALPNAPFGVYFLFVTSNDNLWTGSRYFYMNANDPNTKSQFAAALTGYASGGQVSLLFLNNSTANPPVQGTFADGVNAGSL